MNLNTYFEKGLTFPDYLDKVKRQNEKLDKEGDPQGFVKYYSMNLKRMERLNRRFKLSEEQKARLKKLSNDFRLLVISEGWCGDAAQSVPVIQKFMEDLGVKTRLVFRDENPELMDAYLTDGARSIPIFIGIDKEGNELFHWGPRPEAGMEMLRKHKADPEVYTDKEFHEDLQMWYNHDKGETTFNEFLKAIK